MAQGMMRSNRTRDGIAASLVENIADLEDAIYEVDQRDQTALSEAVASANSAAQSAANTEQEAQSALTEMDAILESLQMSRASRINRPNLLKQNFWTQREMPTSAVITEVLTVPAETAEEIGTQLTFTVSNSAITTSYKLHGKTISDYSVVNWTTVTATFAAGSATITVGARLKAHTGAVTVTVYLCTVANRNVCYGNASWISGSSCPYLDSISSGKYPGDDNVDGIVHSVVDLATADQISEADGDSYTKAIQFNITANTAYGNVEWLMYYYPNSQRVYTQGATDIKNYNHIEELTPGHHYTIGCWARVISGGEVWMKFGYGGMYNNDPINRADGQSGVSDWVVVSGSEWKRYYWEFDFNPTGAWYSETSATVDGVTKVTRTYNWAKKVCFGVGRKNTAVVQLCGFRLVEGGMWLPTKYDEIKEMLLALTDRVTALENAQSES